MVEDKKAVIQHAGNDFFIAISPTGYALTLDTNHERASAPSPMELLLIALATCVVAGSVMLRTATTAHSAQTLLALFLFSDLRTDGF